MHRPVLLKETIELLQVSTGSRYIDATAGEGGHSQAIIERGGEVLVMDRDINQIVKLKQKFEKTKQATIVHANFCDIRKMGMKFGFDQIDGIVFDLGLSYEQLEHLGIGLSYKMLHENLDMRLDQTNELSAKDYLNKLSENELYEIFARNSEEIYSRMIAQAIVKERSYKRFETVGDLVSLVKRVVTDTPNKSVARVFQAVRIEANNEIHNLHMALEGSCTLLKKKGRLVVISFHSLEDRVVKQFIKSNHLKQVTKKVVTGSRDHFSFERSAKLRAIEI